MVGASSAADRPDARVGTAIVRAFPAGTKSYWNRIPKTCHALDIRVSNNGRWATVTSVFTPTEQCERWAGDGYSLLRRLPGGSWRIVFEGSDPPPCSLRVRRDLIRTCLR
jgi:hypothetical protein